MLIRHIGAMLLGLLMTQTACSGPVRATHPTAQEAQDGPGPDARAYEVGVFEADSTDVKPVEVSREEYTRALTQLTKGLTSSRRPLEQAREVLDAPEETEVAFAVRVEGGHIVQVAPLPGPPRPTAADVALRQAYLELCEQQYGGGDCLDFLQDGPVLDEGDKQRLVLAIALGAVLEETKQGLEHGATWQADARRLLQDDYFLEGKRLWSNSTSKTKRLRTSDSSSAPKASISWGLNSPCATARSS